MFELERLLRQAFESFGLTSMAVIKDSIIEDGKAIVDKAKDGGIPQVAFVATICITLRIGWELQTGADSFSQKLSLPTVPITMLYYYILL